MPGTDGGSVGISNTRRPSRCSTSLQTPCGSRSPSIAGSPTCSSARSASASSAQNCARQAGSSNLRAIPSALMSARSSFSSSSTARASISAWRRLAAHRLGCMSRIAGVADDADALQLLDVTAGGRLGHERRRPQRADRRRQQDVALAAHRCTRSRAAARRRRTPRTTAAPRRQRRRRAARRDDPAPSFLIAAQRLAHELGRVAEHIDRPGREVRRTDALGEHADARAALRQPCRRGQPGTSRRRSRPRRSAAPLSRRQVLHVENALGRSSRRVAPGAAGRRTAPATRPSSAPRGSRAATGRPAPPSARRARAECRSRGRCRNRPGTGPSRGAAAGGCRRGWSSRCGRSRRSASRAGPSRTRRSAARQRACVSLRCSRSDERVVLAALGPRQWHGRGRALPRARRAARRPRRLSPRPSAGRWSACRR